MEIVELDVGSAPAITQVAELLVDAFPQAWPDSAAAEAEIHESFGDGRLSLIAVDEECVVGWIGGIRQYDGLAWELHPLVVRADRRRQGIGVALVAELEARVRDLGALTIWLGTDDELDQTSLSGIDLYADLWQQIAAIKNIAHHPYEFYEKQGYRIVGVLPDVNGFGKPDILMAKRVAQH